MSKLYEWKCIIAVVVYRGWNKVYIRIGISLQIATTTFIY